MAETDDVTADDVGSLSAVLDVGRSEKPEPAENEKLMPTARKDRTFTCSVCDAKTTAKTMTAVCIGVDLAVVVKLPGNKYEVYKNGFNEDGEPELIPGQVAKVDRENANVYAFDGSKYLTNDGWVPNSTGKVPGEHAPTEMKEER